MIGLDININPLNFNLMITKITSNKQKRTFTIHKGSLKFRTGSLSKSEFNDLGHNTRNDWQSYLNDSQDYTQLK